MKASNEQPQIENQEVPAVTEVAIEAQVEELDVIEAAELKVGHAFHAFRFDSGAN